MNLEIAKWYLERVDAYLLTPELAQERYQFPPELFLEILKRGFGVDSFAQAKAILEQITQGLFTQNIPDGQTLLYWQEELKKSQEQKKQITEKVAKEMAKEMEAKISLAKKYRNILQENVKELAVAPDIAGKAAWQLTETLAAQIDEEPTKSTLEEHSQFLTASLPLMLEKAGCVVPQTSLTNITQQLLKNTSPETTSLINARAAAVIKPEIEPQIPEAKEIPQVEETLFTPEVKEKMSEEEEGVAFAPVYTVLNPPVAASFAKKVGLAPVVKTLQFIDIVAGDQLQKEIAKDATKKEMILQWREKLHQGLGSADLQQSYDVLSSAGVSPEAPQMKALEEKRGKMEEYEKAHPRISRLLDHYHQFTKITGRRQIFAKEIQAFLPRLSPKLAWFNKLGKQTYSLKLKRTLDSIGTRFFFYEKKTLVSGKTITYFALPDKLTRLVTLGRVQSFAALKTLITNKTIKPLAAALGKTAIGKAVGQAVKKGAAAILAKLGLAAAKLGLAAIPSVVTQVVAVGWAAFDILRALFSKKGREILKKILLVGLGVVLAIAGLLVAFPVSLLFFGLSFLTIGAVLISPVFLAGIVSGVGGAAGQGIGMIGGIIRLIPLSPLGTSFAAILIAVFSGIVALAFFIVILTSGAFILPIKPEALAPSISAYINISKTVSKTSLTNEELPTKLTYNLTVGAKDKELKNVQIIDKTTVSREGSTPTIPTQSWNVDEITSSAPWEQAYNLDIDNQFTDSLITNTVTVTANVDGANQINTTSLTVVVGNPPEDCPRPWPTVHGVITQGPGGTYSHQGRQAIDIGLPDNLQTVAKATHRGIVSLGTNPTYGEYVKVRGRCLDKQTNIIKEISTYYLRILPRFVNDGQEVHLNDELGIIGYHGTGLHLHYEFELDESYKIIIPMAPPYIPAQVSPECNGCISWP